MNVTLSKLVEQVTKIYDKDSKAYSDKEAKLIVKEYFKMITDVIFKEQAYLFPAHFGEMIITRRSRTAKEIRDTARKKRCNPSTLQYKYTIEFDSPKLEYYHYKFDASVKLKRRLYHSVVKERKYFTEKIA